MSRGPSKSRLFFTRRAARDLRDIEKYSIDQWGKRTAARYVDDLEAGLEHVIQQPRLLEPLPEFHPAFRFYRVNKHLLVCDVREKSIVVVTVLHASMDIPGRLAELLPTAAREIECLHNLLHQRSRGE